MRDSQLEVLKGCIECLKNGEQLTLVSVAQTWGTSPRPVGALLAVSSSGRFFGSVSGGCVEEDLIERLVNHPITTPQILLYGETQEERHRFGLPCGGVLQLIAEPFNNKDDALFLIDALENRRTLVRLLDLNSGEINYEDYTENQSANLTETHWTNIYGPVWHLLIVGAGETGRYLAEMALTLGFRVSVSDPRPDYRSNWSFDQVPLLDGFPDDAIEQMTIDHRTAIVTVAHDPRVDDMALLQALHSDAFYVGALGSEKNNQSRRQRLKEHFNFTQEQVDKLKGPVGLPIGSKTPAEIALAILSEITALKNGIDIRAQLEQSDDDQTVKQQVRSKVS